MLNRLVDSDLIRIQRQECFLQSEVTYRLKKKQSPSAHFLQFAVGCGQKTAVTRPFVDRFRPFLLQIILDKERLLNKNVFSFALSCSVKLLQAVEHGLCSNEWHSPIGRLISLIFGEHAEEHLSIRHAEKISSIFNRYCVRGRSLTHGILKSERNSKIDGILGAVRKRP